MSFSFLNIGRLPYVLRLPTASSYNLWGCRGIKKRADLFTFFLYESLINQVYRAMFKSSISGVIRKEIY